MAFRQSPPLLGAAAGDRPLRHPQSPCCGYVAYAPQIDHGAFDIPAAA